MLISGNNALVGISARVYRVLIRTRPSMPLFVFKIKKPSMASRSTWTFPLFSSSGSFGISVMASVKTAANAPRTSRKMMPLKLQEL